MTIKIPVSADFDPSAIEGQLQQFREKLNALGQQIASANKVQFEPVSKTTLDDLRKVTAQFEVLKRVSGDLNRRINATGQKGAGLFDLDWSKLYPDEHSRARQMAKSFQYVTSGTGIHTPAAPPETPEQRRRRTGGLSGTAASVAQAGLRASGPAGGVAAGALGTGMSAGFGAGLMGLMGGMLALGIGKIIGAVKEKVGEAEDNEVAYDTLKRSIGDVSVSFDALKIAVKSTAEANNITYREAIKLSGEFAKLSNLSSEQYKEALAKDGNIHLGIGMSRGFGLDPSSGVGALGTVRGVRAVRDEMETRRFALLIGETIGKSGAFAKAEEVMGAISDYTVSQTRNNLSSANTAGFAGMFAGLVGSGIPGLDPAGAGGLLSRVNASLTAGGAKGEASQYFTGAVGRMMGLDPIQTQMMREGGAFSTNKSTFGAGSIWAQFMGEEGPGGDQTHLSQQLAALRNAYGNNRGLLAQATSEHMGVNMAQAMALHLVSPEQMNEMSQYGDMSKLSGESIGNMSRALFGTAQDRADIANSLYRRKGDGALSADEVGLLDDVFKMDGAKGAEAQKAALAELLSTRGQEDTQGKDIRDSKNALDNLKVSMAERLIPMTQTMRDGILKIAGVGKDGKTTESLLVEMATAESEGRLKGMQGGYDTRYKDISDERKQLLAEARSLPSGSPERAKKEREAHEIIAKQKQMQEEHAKDLQDERAALRERIEQIRNNLAQQAEFEREENELRRERIKVMREQVDAEKESGGGDRFTASGTDGSGIASPSFPARSSGAGAGADALAPVAASLSEIENSDQRANAKAFLDVIGMSEGANYNTLVGHGSFNKKVTDLSRHPNVIGMRTGDGPSTAAGKYQITGTTWRSLSHGGKAAFTEENQDAAAIELLKRRGAWNDVLNGNWEAAVAKLGNEWQSLPSGTSIHQGKRSWSQFRKYLATAKANQGTPIPKGGSTDTAEERRFGFDDVNVNVTHTNERGETVKPPEQLVTQVSNNFYGGRR